MGRVAGLACAELWVGSASLHKTGVAHAGSPRSGEVAAGEPGV